MTGSNAFSTYGRGSKARNDAAPSTAKELFVSILLILAFLQLWRVAHNNSRFSSAKPRELKPSAGNGCCAVFSRKPLLHFLDFFFYFFCPLGIELFFIGDKFAEQSQKLSSVYTLLVRYILEHFNGELVVG